MAEKVKSSSLNRVQLGKALPLMSPFAVHIFPSYYCDFKCCYCIHSLKEEEFSKLHLKRQLMDFGTFKNAIDGLSAFESKLKLLNFAGHGEPLLNSELPKMIAYAVKKEVTEKTELVTNANRLTEKTSLDLIEAGLDSIRISVQGLSNKKYKEISDVNINFEMLVEQIGFFYRHKRNCRIYIKIIDIALAGIEEEKKYFELFSGICDFVSIEHLVPTASLVDYDSIRKEYRETQQGFEYKKVAACPMPFYMMIVEPDGNVRTCCATTFPLLLGNVNRSLLSDIWKDGILRDFWRMQLKGKRKDHNICSSCKNPDYGLQPGDEIDYFCEEIIKRMDN